MVLKYIPISEFVAAALIGRFQLMHRSEYEQSINKGETPFGAGGSLFVNTCKVSVQKHGKSLINLKYSVSIAEGSAET